jgi:hypothetical protein
LRDLILRKGRPRAGVLFEARLALLTAAAKPDGAHNKPLMIR